MKKIYELIGWNFDNIIQLVPDLNLDEWVKDYPITFPCLTNSVDPFNNPPNYVWVGCDTGVVEQFPFEILISKEMCIIPKLEYDTLIEELEEYKMLWQERLE